MERFFCLGVSMSENINEIALRALQDVKAQKQIRLEYHSTRCYELEKDIEVVNTKIRLVESEIEAVRKAEDRKVGPLTGIAPKQGVSH